MTHKFYTLDVFTDRRFGGNPLAVVDAADDLSSEDMQAIAREFNLSETVFVLKPTSPAHSAKVRIFTPSRELPFAGHPTIGTAILLAELRQAAGTGNADQIIALEEQIGTVRIGVKLRDGEAAFAEFDAPKLPGAPGALPSLDRLSSALGLTAAEIGFENHRPVRVTAGSCFAYIPVTSLEAIGKARVSSVYWAEAFTADGIDGVYLYTRQCVLSASHVHARMFAPDLGVAEDSATGSAAVGLAAVIHAFDQLRDGAHKRTVEQGFEMSRPSQIDVTAVVTQGRLETVRIAGRAVRISEGQLLV